MNELLAQMSLIGQGNDIEGWMDILILVVIAAVYGLGAILKSAKSKKEEQEQKQGIQKPQQKPSKGGRGLFEQFVMEVKKAAEEARKGTETIKPGQTAVQKTSQPQVTVLKHAGVAKQVSQTPAKAAPAKPKILRAIPKVQTEFEKSSDLDAGMQSLPGFASKVVGLPGKKKKPAETADAILLDDILWDYDNPDELKRAIVHYEILGKPLSLRNPDECIIGLC